MSAFYLIVRGETLEVASWKRVAASHAAALKLIAASARWNLVDETELLIVILDHPARRDAAHKKLATLDVGASFELHVNDARPGTATSVLLDPGTASVRVRVPFASPDQAYLCRTRTASLVTNDLRLAVARQELSLDPRGVYGLLQYGAVPAPFSLFRGVERLRPGHESSLDSTHSTRLSRPVPFRGSSTSGDETFVLARIDSVLLERRPRAIFFSGGVDSSLLAARIAAAGIRDVPLLNYAFGANDPETAHAELVASHLGLPFERIEHSTEEAVDVLAHAARDYSYPFGDYSSLPTNLLVRASAPWLPPGSEVLDGTGADGVFAVGFAFEGSIRSRYEPLGLLPPWIGELAGRIHRWAGLIATDGTTALTMRLIHRATTMPPLLAALIAQNSLHGECFRVAREVRTKVTEAAMELVASLAPSTSTADRATTLDVVHVCGGIFAAKDFDPLRHRGVDALYPFLHPDVLGPSLELPWSTRCAGAEVKALLKGALARQIPSNLVYRKKSGFGPPVLQMFTDDMHDFIRSRVLRRDAPLAGFLRWRRVERLFARAFGGEPLHAKAYNLVWVLAFVGAWIDGLTQLRAEMQSNVRNVDCGEECGAGS
jgi:asparagine synthase (glutamine-hydrolysing)